jgi:hypothetical protein
VCAWIWLDILLNSVCWSPFNLHLTHEVSLHDVKDGMCCAMNAKQIIGPIFYVEIINFDRYVRLILTEFFAELTETDDRTKFSPTLHIGTTFHI